MDVSTTQAATILALGASPVLLGVLGWSLRRNVKNSDARDEETRRIATDAAASAAKLSADLAAAVREEIARSGAETRQAVDALGAELRTATATLGRHGERLAGGDVKIASLDERVKGLEERERERGCFPGCVARARGDLGGGG
jgi:hypothetical protein